MFSVKNTIKLTFAAVSVSFACSPCLRTAWQILNSKEKEKVSLHWCLNDKSMWQDGTERACLCKRILLYASITRAQAGSAHEHTSPPTLPKHFLTWQIRLCESPLLTDIAGICHISVFMLVFHGDKETWNEPSCHLSFSLSLFLSICSSGYCRRKQEYGAKVNITCCIIFRLAL